IALTMTRCTGRRTIPTPPGPSMKSMAFCSLLGSTMLAAIAAPKTESFADLPKRLLLLIFAMSTKRAVNWGFLEEWSGPGRRTPALLSTPPRLEVPHGRVHILERRVALRAVGSF